MTRPGIIVGVLAIAALLAGCSVPGQQGVPPEGSRDAIVEDILDALAANDVEAMAALFPAQPSSEIERLFEDCGTIDPAHRDVPDVGDIVPYSLTVYMSGPSVVDGETIACYVHVRWEGEHGPWSICSKSIVPSDVPTLSPDGARLG